MDLIEDETLWTRFLQRHGYIPCQHIGYGSFGDVFSVTKPAEDENLKYALKRLLTRRKILEDEYAMMEIHSLLHLQHENIIPLIEVFLSKKVACIVMELAPLGNLEMFYKNSGSEFTSSFVTSTFCQILKAVEFCHSFYLAHRDINPSNVLVFNRGLVKLADFGLCFQCKNEDNGKLILCSDYLGQDTYLAPEVKMCKPYYAMPADVWSLGCVLRYLATRNNCVDIDQSKCVNSVDNEASRSTGYLNEKNDNKPINKNPHINSHSQHENDGNVTVLFTCFVNKLCQISLEDRPTVENALSCWKNETDSMNLNEDTNIAQFKKSEREE